MMKAHDVTCHYKKKDVLRGVSFELRKDRITTFIGKSGAGKTTLMRCIANLHSLYEGSITYRGRDLKCLLPRERAKTLGFVSQQFHLFPHLTTLQNCTFALQDVLGSKKEADQRAEEILSHLHMLPYIHAFPSQLSGGQQQRVAIARALVLSPKILLLDEPTSALDPESKKSLETLLVDLNRKGLTIALSSHDMPFVSKISQYIYYVEDGKIVEECDCLSENPISKQKIGQFVK
jgi:ABC-type polar amino acid transport system ATPase subunit